MELKLEILHLTDAINYLHEINKVHCNICPENIQVTMDGNFKLAGLQFITNVGE